MGKLRDLIGCETSGVMRRAFDALGHDVWSCDLLPAEDGSNRHIRCDVRDLLHDGWDLLAVMHPPCTRLCNSGVRWLTGAPQNPPGEATLAERTAWAEMAEVERLAIIWRLLDEGDARERLPADLPKPQTVQPWWFGEPFFKATGFYLRGLPALAPTNRLTPPRKVVDPDQHRRWSAVHYASPGAKRWQIRSRTFEGVAAACAAQWGGYAREAVTS